MRDVVVIDKYASNHGYHGVYLNGKQVGAIDAMRFRFDQHLPYTKLLDCDKELTDEHVDEFICVLQRLKG
jgi:hypothetical protein